MSRCFLSIYLVNYTKCWLVTNSNLTSVQFSNKRLDFCQTWFILYDNKYLRMKSCTYDKHLRLSLPRFIYEEDNNTFHGLTERRIVGHFSTCLFSSFSLFHFSFEKQREHSQFCQPVLAWEENRRSSNLALPLSAISILPCHPMITYDDLPLFRLMTYMEEHGPPPPPHWNLHQTKIQGNEIMIYMKIKCLF